MSRRVLQGNVISTKNNKTIKVSVEKVTLHPYGKTVKSTKKYTAHDENNICKTGDQVLIEESRPISKTKHWTLLEVKNTTA